MIERTGSRRRLRSWLSGSAVVVAALLTGLAGSAFANAPNDGKAPGPHRTDQPGKSQVPR